MSGGGGDRWVVPTGGIVLDEKSSSACELAAGPGQVLLAWTGSDHRVNLLQSDGGLTFGGKQTLAHRVGSGMIARRVHSRNTTVTGPFAPALAVARRGTFVAWTGADERPKVWHDDLPPPGPTVLPQRARSSPALSPWGDELALAWTGTDRHLNLAWTAGGAFGGHLTLDQTSAYGPALAAVGDELALAWTGISGGQVNLLVSQGEGFGSPWTLGEMSLTAPAICAVDELLVVAWIGLDYRINVMPTGPADHWPPMRVPAKSGRAPALAALDGALLLAWTGTDRRLNVAHLPRPT